MGDNRKRVLIADPNRYVMNYFIYHLHSQLNGIYNVGIALSGEEAIYKINKGIDFLILSSIMPNPGPPGFYIAENLKNKQPNIPIAFQSALIKNYRYIKRSGVELFDKIVLDGKYIGNKEVVEYVKSTLG